MKKLMVSLFLVPFVFGIGHTALASEQGLVFICSKGLGYSQSMVEKAFKAQLDEPHLVENSKLKPQLLAFLDVDAKKYKKAWDKNFFRRALSPPVVRNDDASVVEYVAAHGEAIGYVSVAPSNPGIEVCGK